MNNTGVNQDNESEHDNIWKLMKFSAPMRPG